MPGDSARALARLNCHGPVYYYYVTESPGVLSAWPAAAAAAAAGADPGKNPDRNISIQVRLGVARPRAVQVYWARPRAVQVQVISVLIT